MTLFDTLKVAYQLRDAGFEEKQADALVSAFANDIGANLATKDDVAALRQAIEALESKVDSNNAALRQQMASDNAALRNEIALREERMEARLNARFTVLTLGLAGLMLTAIGIATGVIVALLG